MDVDDPVADDEHKHDGCNRAAGCTHGDQDCPALSHVDEEPTPAELFGTTVIEEP